LDVRDELLTIAEIAIGIAGFSGVIAAFLQRDGLHQLDRVRFINLFATTFTILVLAYVPIVISHLVTDNDRIWSYSSAVMAIVWFLGTGFTYRLVLPEIRTYIPYQSRRLAIPVLGIPTLSNLGIQCLNIGGWLWEPGFLAYLFGLFIYLYGAGVMFVFVILYRPPAAPAD